MSPFIFKGLKFFIVPTHVESITCHPFDKLRTSFDPQGRNP